MKKKFEVIIIDNDNKDMVLHDIQTDGFLMAVDEGESVRNICMINARDRDALCVAQSAKETADLLICKVLEEMTK